MTVDLVRRAVPSRSENAPYSAGSRRSRYPSLCVWSSVALQDAGLTADKARTSDCKLAAPKNAMFEDDIVLVLAWKVTN